MKLAETVIIPVPAAERQRIIHVAKKYMATQKTINKHNSGQILKPLNRWVIGCLGEWALAQYLLADWDEVDYDPNANDVEGYEVRTRSTIEYGGLPTHEYDKPAIYVSAGVDKETQTVHLFGWTRLADANIPENWRADWPKPCYLTERTALHPMATLPPAY